jgi:hypothetical protein
MAVRPDKDGAPACAELLQWQEKDQKGGGRNGTVAEDGGLKSRQAEFNAKRRSALPAMLL